MHHLAHNGEDLTHGPLGGRERNVARAQLRNAEPFREWLKILLSGQVVSNAAKLGDDHPGLVASRRGHPTLCAFFYCLKKDDGSTANLHAYVPLDGGCRLGCDFS